MQPNFLYSLREQEGQRVLNPRSALVTTRTPVPRNAIVLRRPNLGRNLEGAPEIRVSAEHNRFLTLFLRYLALLPIRSRPTSVIAFKTLYIDYHLQNPMKKMSPSVTIRTLSMYFKAINKTRLQGIVYLEGFEAYKPQVGEIQGTTAVTAADLDLLNSPREELERNRNGVWITSTKDEMLTMLKHHSALAFDENILHLSQEDRNM